MSDDIRQHVNPSSEEFKEGVEAGLNSAEHTKNWQAGNDLGQELKGEGMKRPRVAEGLVKESSTSLFVRNTPRGDQGNLQDEKDEMGE